jgi:CBS domain-containing protein
MKQWQVADVLTEDVATVREETPYRRIVDILRDRRISAVPVVDNAGRVLGVVSEADLLRKIESAGRPEERRLFESRRRRAAHVKAGATRAGELMTQPAVTTTPDRSIPAAAQLMDAEHVTRLPVVDDLGRLVGIVTRSDLLKVHLRPDADIRQDVADALCQAPALGDAVVAVEVCDGLVTLAGEVDQHSEASAALRQARAVAGVVAVNDQLTFRHDDTALETAIFGGA